MFMNMLMLPTFMQTEVATVRRARDTQAAVSCRQDVVTDLSYWVAFTDRHPSLLLKPTIDPSTAGQALWDKYIRAHANRGNSTSCTTHRYKQQEPAGPPT
jgi:hypothetical protein